MSGQELTWAGLDLAWVLGLVAAVGVGILLHFQWKKGVIRRLGDHRLIKRMIEDTSFAAQATKWVLLFLGIGLVATSILRPQYGTREAELQNRGIDIVIALDLSKSMMVRDVAPNRLKAAIVEINEVLERLSGGRVALVPFAGTAFTQTPLTTDLSAVRSYLEELRVEDMPIGGTRIGLALKHAMGVFEEAGRELDDSDLDADLAAPQASHFKAIILVTDGEDHDEDAMAIAQAAAKQNVRIYTVGIGSERSGARIPQISGEGDRVGWVADDGGKPLFSYLNTTLLRDLADAAGGTSFVYGKDDVASGLSAGLDTLEKQEYTHHYENLKEDRFQFLLVPAFVLLLLETLIADRRRRRRKLVVSV